MINRVYINKGGVLTITGDDEFQAEAEDAFNQEIREAFEQGKKMVIDNIVENLKIVTQ